MDTNGFKWVLRASVLLPVVTVLFPRPKTKQHWVMAITIKDLLLYECVTSKLRDLILKCRPADKQLEQILFKMCIEEKCAVFTVTSKKGLDIMANSL